MHNKDGYILLSVLASILLLTYITAQIFIYSYRYTKITGSTKRNLHAKEEPKKIVRSDQAPDMLLRQAKIVGIELSNRSNFPMIDYNKLLTDKSIISSPEELKLSSYVRLDANTAIVAGGDLNIDELRAGSLDGIYVTLISATGIVTVKTITGNIRIKVIAWKGADVPESALLAGPLNLPLVEDQITRLAS